MTFYAKDRSRHDRAWARKFPARFDVITSEFDVFIYMLDVIVDEVKKYSTSAWKLKEKAGKQFEKLDVITIGHVKIERKPVKHAASINLQRRIHVKSRSKQRTSKP